MATNEVFPGDILALTVGASVAARHPVVVGKFHGITLTATESTGTTTASVATKGVFDLSVKAINDSGNSAVAVGDIVYYDADDNPHLSKKATSNSAFGVALEAVTAGQTATIRVKLIEGIDETPAAAHVASIGTGGNLDETVAKGDIDDAGTIDGTEIAAMLSLDHARVNAISAKVDALIVALENAGLMATS